MKLDLHSDTIRTFTGKNLDVFNPDPEMICIEDIAHALAQTPRFAGHLPYFYSVAHHSVMCAEEFQNLNMPAGDILAALMHDASEAYLTDIPRPIKKRLPEYKKIEDGLMKVISEKFGFEYPLNNSVKYIDDKMLQWEWESLMNGKQQIEFDAVEQFLFIYDQYKKL